MDILYELENPKGTPLQYDKYKEYLQQERKGHWWFKFPNNYGASVIKKYGSYGYEDDKFELGVSYYDENGVPSLTYNTPITNNVIGWLTNDEVLEYLEKIKNLEE